MKSSDPISPKYQGIVFGVYLYIIVPAISVFYFDQLSWKWFFIGLLVWYLQMVGVLVSYHRYFAHRSFKTGRVMQAILALQGCISGQKGPIFWASQHRHHHRYCEAEKDRHSPYEYGDLKGWNMVKGFLWAQMTNLFVHGVPAIEDKYVRDLIKQKELVFIEKQSTLIYYLFVFSFWLLGGMPGLVFGALLPTFFSWNAVMLVNSAVHIWGDKPYKSKQAPDCNATNIWWLSLIMLGDNWHNNHHADQNSARAGFYWWQLDLNYCLIYLWGKMGLVWDIRQPDFDSLEPHPDREKSNPPGIQNDGQETANPTIAVN